MTSIGAKIYGVQFGSGREMLARWHGELIAETAAEQDSFPMQCESYLCEGRDRSTGKGKEFDALTETFALVEYQGGLLVCCEDCGHKYEQRTHG